LLRWWWCSRGSIRDAWRGSSSSIGRSWGHGARHVALHSWRRVGCSSRRCVAHRGFRPVASRTYWCSRVACSCVAHRVASRTYWGVACSSRRCVAHRGFRPVASRTYWCSRVACSCVAHRVASRTYWGVACSSRRCVAHRGFRPVASRTYWCRVGCSSRRRVSCGSYRGHDWLLRGRDAHAHAADGRQGIRSPLCPHRRCH